MRQRTIHLEQSAPFLIATAAAAAAVSACFCFGDVYSLLLYGSLSDTITAILKTNALTVLLFVALFLFFMKRRDVECSPAVLIVPILWGIFFFFRFASNIQVRNYSLILIQSIVCIAYFSACTYLLVIFRDVIKRFGKSETCFALLWAIAVIAVFALSVLKTRNVDLCVSAVELGIFPLIFLVQHGISIRKQPALRDDQEQQSSNSKIINYYTVLLFLSCVFFTLYYFNREATDLEGIDAYCALLMSQGKMIYRDFFFYVPPFYIFRQYLVWLLFDGAILPIRILGIAERAVLICIIFRLLCRWFKPSHAYIACTFAFFLYNSNVFNSYGDYTQTCQLLLIIAVYFAAFFVDCLRNQKEKSALGWLFCASVIATQSLMCKQSIGAVALFCLFAVLILYCLITGEGKRTFRWIGCILLGFFVSLLPYLIWFVWNHSLLAFVNQVFLASLNSKGLVVSGTSSQTSTFVRIFQRIFNIDSIVLWACALTAILFHLVQRNVTKGRRVWRILSLLASLATVLKMVQYLRSAGFFSSLFYLTVALLQKLSRPQILLFAVVILFFAVCFIVEKITKKGQGVLFAVIFSALIFFSWFVTTLFSITTLREILQTYRSTLIWPVFYEFAFHFCAIFFVAELARLIVEKKTTLPLECWFFIAVAMANALVSLMGGGTASFACNGALFTIPFAVCIWLSLFKTEKADTNQQTCRRITANELWKKAKIAASAASFAFLIGVIGTVSLISMGQHINCVYSFYGWTAEPITDVNAYTIDLDRYEGMRVSKKTKVTLEQVTKLVAENSEEGDFVWTFPATKIYNILTDRLDQPTFTPTYFFDTCPDSIADSDLQILKSNPPDIIIWKEMGEDCWTFYETNYRNGAELGQREIQRWFESVKDTQYTLIGNVYNEYVYKRIDGTAPAYTYYSDGSDFVGNAEEVANNLPKSNIGSVVYDFVDGTGLLSANRTMALLILLLSIIPALMLFKYQQLWKVVCMALLVIALTLKMSLVYYLVFAFVLVYALLFEKKNWLTWLELCLLSAIAISAILQWSSYWSILQNYIVIPAAIGLYFVFSIDTLLTWILQNKGNTKL